MAGFEIAALFSCLYREGISTAISKLADFCVPSSQSYIFLALIWIMSILLSKKEKISVNGCC